MHPDRFLDEYAARQYGAFSRDQARRAGLTPKMIETRLASGAWLRLGPAVYALASAPPKWERQLAAALLTKREAIVAGRSAAHLHGFEGFNASRPVIMIDRKENAVCPLARVIRSSRFESIGRVRKRGFVVTNEVETVMTLAKDLSKAQLATTVDWLLARRSCSIDEFAQVVAMSDGVPGVARLRPIVGHRLPDAYQPPTSELERFMYPILDDPRVPQYTRQMPISYMCLDATVDAYIPLWRLIVEGDGRRWHTREADFERDRARDNESLAHGIAVLRFTYQMLRDRPDDCLRTLLRAGQTRMSA